MIEWIHCPDCGKKLCKASVKDQKFKATLFLWCKRCGKEVEIKIEPKGEPNEPTNTCK